MNKGLYMIGLAGLVPLGLLASVVGLVLGILSGTWAVLGIGLSMVVIGLLLSLGQSALFAAGVSSAAGKFAQDMIVEERRAVFGGVTAPLIGYDIPWPTIVRQVFRVIDFNRSDTKIVNDKVVDTGPGKPYGYLLVESPVLGQRAVLPIFHRDDFWLAASVFDEPQFAARVETDELLVTYAPRKVTESGLSGDAAHAFHYVLAPAGTLARYYGANGELRQRVPAPELVFGAFVYEGQIRVGVNQAAVS